MITGRQVRAARALLNWKQEMLAEKALVALTALKRLESERQLQVHDGTRDQVLRPARSFNDRAMIQKHKCGTNEDVDPAKP